MDFDEILQIFIDFFLVIHSILVLLQATTLNVAINSKYKALLTVMMSNNVCVYQFKILKFF